MTDRPIHFNDEMVRAILSGRKTQTRRPIQSPAKNMQRAGMQVIKHREPGDPWYRDCVWSMRGRMGVWGDYTHQEFLALCPFGAIGDRLWVRECFKAYGELRSWGGGHDVPEEHFAATICYRADRTTSMRTPHMENWRMWLDCPPGDPWRPSSHMPRWASRLMLRVTDVRVELLQDISEADACAEGMGSPITRDCKRPKFIDAWSRAYGPESWAANPWVWVVGFEEAKP